LLSLDREGLGKVVSRLGPETGETLRALMAKRTIRITPVVGSAKVKQEWGRAWEEWWSCIEESCLEEGKYRLQENDWDAPELDLLALVEDLEPIAARIRKLIDRVMDEDLDFGFSMVEAYLETVKRAGAGLPEWMVPVEEELRFEKHATHCLLEWEVRAALEEGLDAYGFVLKIRTLELEAPMLVLAPDTLIQSILEKLSDEDLRAVLEGMDRDRRTREWKRELDSSDSVWFKLHQELTRQRGTGRSRECYAAL